MKLEIRTFEKSFENEWDKFIETESLNGNFLHTRKFFRHNHLNERDDCSYMFYKKNKLVAVIPFTLIVYQDQLILNSFLRATYGGFIVSKSVGVEEAVEMVSMIIQKARQLFVTEIIIRNPFRFLNKNWCDESDYAMWYNGFKVKYRELESTILLDDSTSSRIQNGAKYNIKKAWKSTQVRVCENYIEFWELLVTNLSQKHSSKPTHSIDEFLYLRELVGHDKIHLFGGFTDGKLICGVIVFLFSPIAIHAQYIASDIHYQEIRPLNAVIDYIISWGKERSYNYLNLGMGNEECGKIINFGLFHFKEGFGARGVLRETMHLSLK